MKRKIPNNKTPLNIFYQILKQHLKNCLYVLMNKLFLKRLNDIVYPNRNNSVHLWQPLWNRKFHTLQIFYREKLVPIPRSA